MSPVITFRNLDVVFGPDPRSVIPLLDQGLDRATILERAGHVVGVRNANMTVARGEIAVLMGLSGSGKSSLLRCVNGLNAITRGKLIVDVGDGAPIDVADATRAEMRRLRTRQVAMVFQQFALLPWRTVAENVGFGLEMRGVPQREADAIIRDKLAMVGLADWAGKFAHELSGGMQQRVGLARAFATDAPVLLMDEPFSALDPLIRDRLQDELLDLQRTLQKTILFVSHDLDEAMKLGNRIAIMESGVIVQQGTPEDIVLNPTDDYVADFVAHMNPLNVLRGGSLMCPVERLPHCANGYRSLDEAGIAQAAFDAGGACTGASLAGQPVPVGGAKPISLAKEGDGPRHFHGEPGTLAVVGTDITMRAVIALRRQTGLPVLLEEDGKVVGCIRDQDIFAALSGARDRA
ncbi:MAG: choline ABC transporter ATP-binding protein [Rhodospirillaceae bacterium]|nr:choline ABC transporter ATP-binding protein [Rhodospirillaceae bacterium]